GAMRTFGVPASWVGHDVSELAPAPRLGQHTAAVLRESNYSTSDIEALVASGAAFVAGGEAGN
ncbi:MAG: CoA transferase, partial [Burkholderiales bacterium]|nr:CoA transferase [Burkholderiales bacterium]